MSFGKSCLALFTAAALVSCMQAPPEQSGESEMPSTAAPGDTATAPATDLIFCPEVQRRLSQQDCDDLTTVAAAARDGVAAFNVPPMERGKATTLQLAISFAPPEAEPSAVEADNSADAAAGDPDDASGAADQGSTDQGSLSGGVSPDNEPVAGSSNPERPEDIVARLPGEVESYKPVVGRFMRASLIGEGFDIKPLSEESQEVFSNGSTTWEWAVTPLKADQHVLTLKTVVEGVTAEGKRFALRSTTRTRNVDVGLNWIDRVRDYLNDTPDWIKAITAVVAAITALIAAIKGLRALFRKPKNDPAE
jgi:hypothetical protein